MCRARPPYQYVFAQQRARCLHLEHQEAARATKAEPAGLSRQAEEKMLPFKRARSQPCEEMHFFPSEGMCSANVSPSA